MEYGELGYFVFKWIHFLAGITWIGVLYYFNFIQGEWFKEIEDQTKGVAVRTLVPRALWWFRWGAMFTFLSGLMMLLLHAHQNNFSLIRSYELYIYTGALLGTLMFLNVWVIIWPAQKIVIASSESVASGGEADPNAAAALGKAGLASRTNTLFSIPMLFFMGAARGLNFLSNDINCTLYAVIAVTVVILILELNAIKGKMGFMASVKGVIHCGLGLTVLLYLLLTFLVCHKEKNDDKESASITLNAY